MNSGIVAGTVKLAAANMTIPEKAVLNTTALAGAAPPQTSGRPSGTNGDGGRHGGRGASCVVKEGQTQEDSWVGMPILGLRWTSLTAMAAGVARRAGRRIMGEDGVVVFGYWSTICFRLMRLSVLMVVMVVRRAVELQAEASI